MQLYHVSDTPGIGLFEPRPAPAGAGIDEDVVWGIDREHLANYLLPRDCPRVTFRATGRSRLEDVERLIGPGGAGRVIAVESGWMERILSERLVLYEFDPASFELLDQGAGYWITRRAVMPVSEQGEIPPLTLLLQQNVELRIMPSLWELREAVAGSSLEFSIIRMRNAAPPPVGFITKYPTPGAGETK